MSFLTTAVLATTLATHASGDTINERCPGTARPVDPGAGTTRFVGYAIGYCCPGCRARWESRSTVEKVADVDRWLARRDEPSEGRSAYADDPLPEDENLRHLTRAQVEGLRSGRGLGLAKPAEMHGMPGPKHVLELANELGLTPTQREHADRLFDRMHDRAVAAGKAVLEAEARVGSIMRDHPPEMGTELARALAEAGAAWAEVALAHIEAHISMTRVLTPAQIEGYARLRGYTRQRYDQDRDEGADTP
ncbi:MAG: hypothetical protein ACYTGC_16610 [Planctomycetota bacterium]|jgi:hypothetical protein